MKKIRFGIIGLGNQGSTYVLKLFDEGKIENGCVSAMCRLKNKLIRFIGKFFIHQPHFPEDKSQDHRKKDWHCGIQTEYQILHVILLHQTEATQHIQPCCHSKSTSQRSKHDHTRGKRSFVSHIFCHNKTTDCGRRTCHYKCSYHLFVS